MEHPLDRITRRIVHAAQVQKREQATATAREAEIQLVEAEIQSVYDRLATTLDTQKGLEQFITYKEITRFPTNPIATYAFVINYQNFGFKKLDDRRLRDIGKKIRDAQKYDYGSPFNQFVELLHAICDANLAIRKLKPGEFLDGKPETSITNALETFSKALQNYIVDTSRVATPGAYVAHKPYLDDKRPSLYKAIYKPSNRRTDGDHPTIEGELTLRIQFEKKITAQENFLAGYGISCEKAARSL